MSKKRFDRIKLLVSDEKSGEVEIAVDIPTYFKVDATALYNAILKELTKQEKPFFIDPDKSKAHNKWLCRSGLKS